MVDLVVAITVVDITVDITLIAKAEIQFHLAEEKDPALSHLIGTKAMFLFPDQQEGMAVIQIA